jgi:outer membrane protein assembly factor BamB
MPDTSGLWPTFRHDAHLTGHQPLPGDIQRPEVMWQHYLGGPIFDAHVVSGRGGKQVLLVHGGCIHAHDSNGTLLWKSQAFGIDSIVAVADVDRDGNDEILATNGKSIFVLAANDGRLLWSVYLGAPFAAGFMHTGALLHHFRQIGPGMQLAVGLLSSREVVLYDFSPGAATPERRHILWMDDFFHPSLLAVDIDNDGKDELIVTKYSAIYAFDPVTGKEKYRCRWSSGGTPKRNYGLFLARDLNRDRYPDFIVLSERVSRHLAVVENHRNGEMSVRWDRFIEHIYPTDQKELRYTFNSCIDIDRNGRMELVVSTYNDYGDGRWWLEVIDAWSGEIRLRMPDLYLRGIQHLNEHDAPVLLVSYEASRIPAESGRIAVMAWDHGVLVEQWGFDSAAFVGRFRRTDDDTTVFRSELPPGDEIWRAIVDDEPSIFIRTHNGDLALLQRFEGFWQLAVLPISRGIVAVLAVDDLDGDGRTEILVSDDGGTVRALHADGREVFSVRVGMRFRYGVGAYYMAKPMQTPVVFADDDARYCVVPDGGSHIHLFRWEEGRSRGVPVWSMPGRGRLGPEETYHSVSVVEIDGGPAVLFAPVGGISAVLQAVRADGEIAGRWEIPDLPPTSAVPAGRMGIYDYLIVPNAGSSLLVVSGYLSASMNSEQTCCIDMTTGDLLWSRRLIGEGEDGRGFGPWNAPTLGGTPEQPVLYFLAKDTVCAVDVRTGELLNQPWQLRPYNTAHLHERGMSMDDFAAYGSLVPVDVDGDGVEDFAAVAVYGGVGILNNDLTMRWWQSAPLSSLSGGHPGIADVDGDGLPELGLSYADGEFVCLRADTGLEKWRLHLGAQASGVVTCDIDGDGRVEFILALQNGELVAIGVSTSGCGLVKWRYDFGYSLGPPVVADIDGDGRAEVLVVSGDGYIYQVK